MSGLSYQHRTGKDQAVFISQPGDGLSWILRCDILTVVTIEISVFCDLTSCRFLEI
jgi:hypothetical protein